MIRRFTLVFSLALFIANTSFSQEKVQISGQVKNSDTKEKTAFCNASVFNAKDSLISVAATNLNGFFKLSLDQGAKK